MSETLQTKPPARVGDHGVVASYGAVNDAVASGAFARLDAAEISEWLAGGGLRVLLFTGPPKRQRDSHDVAVALRELLRDYLGQAHAAVLDPEQEAGLQQRFRVSIAPSLALCAGGEVIEVLPGVRDWADYTAAFSRYLGAA